MENKNIKVSRAKPRKETRLFKTRIIDSTNMKWVRIDKKTIIQVNKDISDEIAIDEYYTKREINKQFNYR